MPLYDTKVKRWLNDARPEPGRVKWLAKQLGMCRQSAGDIVNGRTKPSPLTAQKLITLADGVLTLDDLLEDFQ